MSCALIKCAVIIDHATYTVQPFFDIINHESHKVLTDKSYLDLWLAESLHDGRGIDPYKLGNLLGPGRVVRFTLLLPALLLEFLRRRNISDEG